MLALAFAIIGAGFGPYSSESTALRIQLVDTYCDAESNKLQRTPAEKANAAAKLPCLMLAYRQKLELTGPEKRKAMEVKAKTYELAKFRNDRMTMFGEMCKKVRPTPQPADASSEPSRTSLYLACKRT